MKQKVTYKNFKPKWWMTISKIGFFIFLYISLTYFYDRFWTGFFYLLIALLLFPRTHFFIYKKMNDKFNWIFKSALVLVLFIGSGISTYNYDQIEQAETLRIRLENDKERKEAKRIENQRIDSLTFYYNEGLNYFKNEKYEESIEQINISLGFAKGEKDSILARRTDIYFKSKNYPEAINYYTTLISSEINATENLYNRAVCYIKMNEIAEAVSDLKEAIKIGNEKAEELHDKINPLKRKVSHYVTRCCDGSTSSARGRGACSHHGGVCNWNDPVYTTYREY
ncbi:tetratricopeptide repeat protein [Brumimicrobium aurantiacum]|uniref:DUF3761 domain-containing protein n=1 Tax=Brumimicrobium aurantiacum TaxID=1737063 RepID=A0A3E1EZ92_9FLAO|nr:tetratricopeptide repeat protein [Brumimicrobium aurantiacum]RFC54868.1 DUF3761 domain-containing protein [Brumimicrobium aurantiacum]